MDFSGLLVAMEMKFEIKPQGHPLFEFEFVKLLGVARSLKTPGVSSVSGRNQ